MRVLLLILSAYLSAAVSEPDVGGSYIPPSASRRHLPSPSSGGPASRRYLPVGRAKPRPKQSHHQTPVRHPLPSDLDSQYRTTTFQPLDVAPYQPSSAEVPPNQPPFSYKPEDATPSRRYLPAANRPLRPEPEYPPANYDFEYNVLDDESGNDYGQREGRRGDLVTGRYRVVLPDGRTQVVEYQADIDGYRPVVSYEGEASQGGYSYNKPGGEYEGYTYNKPKGRF